MSKAYIVAGKRTPFVKARIKDPAFPFLHPVDLAAYLVEKTIENIKIKKEDVNDLICGIAHKLGPQGFNPARLIAIKSLGKNIPGKSIDRLCGSSLEAVIDASRTVIAGDAEIIVACGLEDMKNVPIGSDLLPIAYNLQNIWKIISKGPKSALESLPEWYELTPMPNSGELVAQKYNLTRKELDEFALRSQNNSYLSREKGYFDNEIIPIPTKMGIVDRDDGIRFSTIEGLAKLKPITKDGKFITAGNSSQITAGSSCVVIASENAVKKYNLKPLAEYVASSVVACDPKIQLDGPINAIKNVLEKANLKIADIDRFEINEAFASVPLATIKTLGIDINKVNVYGGAIALGHPLGASGARLVTTLLNQMKRENLKYGLATLCIGGGQANAVIIRSC